MLPGWGTATAPVKALAAGNGHTCALTTQGEVLCWGDNFLGQLGDGSFVNHATPQRVVGLPDDVVAISAYHRHTCALSASGGVKCWGYNRHGELGDGTTVNRAFPVDVIGLDAPVVAIAAGGFHTCALTDRGAVECWGANWHGQLGNNSTAQRLKPVDVVGLDRGVDSIATGKYHTCAMILKDGIMCWGYNKFAQIGDTTNTDRWTPSKVYGQTSWHGQLALGDVHTCVLTPNQGVKCWGDNSEGQVGDGTLRQRDRPVVVSSLASGVAALAAGGTHTCALTEGSGVLCWGNNWAGQLGDGTQNSLLTPSYVPGMTDGIVALVAGSDHTCSLNAANQVQCWGSNAFGQIGDGEDGMRLTPTPVTGVKGTPVVVRGGGLHTCALTAGGGVQCWGNNKYGQLGDGTTTSRLSPVWVAGLKSGVASIAVGAFHTCAVTVGGALKCWGDNSQGQLGDGSGVNQTRPVEVFSLNSGVKAVAAGSIHTCALTTGGGVKCWGNNRRGRLGDGTKEQRLTPVDVSGLTSGIIALEAGDSHTCALTASKGVKCWGNNFDGQLGDGTTDQVFTAVDVVGLPGPVQALTAGVFHTCALTASKGVVCWGGNFSGQLGDGTTSHRLKPEAVQGLASGVALVKAGGYHTCATKDSGQTLCWGDNWVGQLGVGNTIIQLSPAPVSGLPSGLIDLAGGINHTCALGSGSAMFCWGSHSQGQLSDGSVPWRASPTLVLGLPEATLTINHPTGAPGSFFTLTGANFPPSHPASLVINGQNLTTTLQTDSSGGISLTLGTSLADEGTYNVTLQALLQASTAFWLTPGATQHPQGGGGPVVEIPAGIAHPYRRYLPVVP